MAERFEMIEALDGGRTGEHWRARDSRLDEPVMVKVLYPHLEDDAAFFETMQREVEYSRRLMHPAVVRSLAVGRRNGTPFVVRDLVEGRPVNRMIDTGPAWQWDQVRHLLKELAVVLDEAHEAGIVHGTLSSRDIFLEQETARAAPAGAIRVKGFGRVDPEAGGLFPSRYVRFMPRGKPSPETDLHALGFIAIALLTGRQEGSVSSRTVSGRSALGLSALPEDARAVVSRLVASDSKQGFRDAGELYRALTAATEQLAERKPSTDWRPIALTGMYTLLLIGAWVPLVVFTALGVCAAGALDWARGKSDGRAI